MSKVKLYFLFGIVVIIAVLTPHIIQGHVLVPEKYAESAIFLLDLILAYIFYFIYKRDVKKISQDKKIIEKNLLASYKYIGKTNMQIELLNQFINSLSHMTDQDKKKEKNIFLDLLRTMVSSVAKSDKGLIRFINAEQAKTIKEFSYHKQGDQFVVRLSNLEALNQKEQFIQNNNINIIQSDYDNSNIRCIFCYSNNLGNAKIDNKLLKTLLNQIHLLFLVSYAQYCNFSAPNHVPEKLQA